MIVTIIPILEIQELKHGEEKARIWRHPAGMEQSQDVSPGAGESQSCTVPSKGTENGMGKTKGKLRW